MVVRIRFFASLAESAGVTEESLEVDPSTDVAALWRLLVERHPGLAAVSYDPLVACDRVYAEWGRRLDGVGEVAFLPPVSGG